MSMAVHQPFCNPRLLKGVVAVMAIGIAAYIVVPPLYWHFAEGLAAVSSSSSTSCAPCAACDCSSHPLLALPHGIISHYFLSTPDLIFLIFFLVGVFFFFTC